VIVKCMPEGGGRGKKRDRGSARWVVKRGEKKKGRRPTAKKKEFHPKRVRQTPRFFRTANGGEKDGKEGKKKKKKQSVARGKAGGWLGMLREKKKK